MLKVAMLIGVLLLAGAGCAPSRRAADAPDRTAVDAPATYAELVYHPGGKRLEVTPTTTMITAGFNRAGDVVNVECRDKAKKISCEREDREVTEYDEFYPQIMEPYWCQIYLEAFKNPEVGDEMYAVRCE